MATRKKSERARAADGDNAGGNDGTNDARNDGANDGQGDGPKAGAMDFDSFLIACRESESELGTQCYVANTAGGWRMGDVDLLPLDDLEERLRAKFQNARRIELLLRVKLRANGHVKHTGRVGFDAIEPLRPTEIQPATSAAPASTDTTAMLIEQNQRLMAQLLASGRTSSPRESTTEQVGALGGLVEAAKALASIGGAGAARTGAAGEGLTVEAVQTLMALGAKHGGGIEKAASFGLEALKMLGPAGVEMLKTASALMMMKIDASDNDDAKAKAKAADREREAAEKKASEP
jgi:hypothetical protein